MADIYNILVMIISESSMPANNSTLKLMERILDKATMNVLRDFFEIESLQNSSTLERFVEVSLEKSRMALLEELDSYNLHNYEIYSGDDRGIKLQSPRSEFAWIVNLMDGRQNFVRGLKEFGVSLSLAKVVKDTAELNTTSAALNFPVQQEVYHAEQGGGSFVNNRRIRVSNRNRLLLSIMELVNVWHSQVKTLALPVNLQSLATHVHSYRSGGSGLMAMAHVASGKTDVGIIDISGTGMLYSYAAGSLLVKEAGGFVSTISLEGHVYLVFGNSELQAEVNTLLA